MELDQLANLDDSNLSDLLSKIQATLTARKEADVKKVKEEILRLAATVGITVTFNQPGGRSRAPGSYAPTHSPRHGGPVAEAGKSYANPSNPAEVWHGRGKRPAWFRELIEAGHNPNEFEIS